MTTATKESRFVANPSAGSNKDAGGKGSKDRDDAAGDKKRKVIPWKSKKFLIGVVALLAVGGGAYKFLAPVPKPGPPVGGGFVKMDPTTLNLDGGHYLKIAVSVQVVKGKADPAAFDTSKAAALIIAEFSNRTVAALSSNPAREHLTADLLTKIKAAYPEEVFQVYLTQFVTQ